jgi:hypothetical protein
MAAEMSSKRLPAMTLPWLPVSKSTATAPRCANVPPRIVTSRA